MFAFFSSFYIVKHVHYPPWFGKSINWVVNLSIFIRIIRMCSEICKPNELEKILKVEES